jgi:hypothetical protein
MVNGGNFSVGGNPLGVKRKFHYCVMIEAGSKLSFFAKRGNRSFPSAQEMTRW